MSTEDLDFSKYLDNVSALVTKNHSLPNFLIICYNNSVSLT